MRWTHWLRRLRERLAGRRPAPPVPHRRPAMQVRRLEDRTLLNANPLTAAARLPFLAQTAHAAAFVQAAQQTAPGPPRPFPVGHGPVGLGTGDFNGDGRTDLAVANQADGTVSLLLGKGDGAFRPGPTIHLPAGSFPVALASGDFGGDGPTDLAVLARTFDGTGKYLGSVVDIFLADGHGAFRPGLPVPLAAGSLPEALVAGHFTTDGHTDLAVANAGSTKPDGTVIAAPSIATLLGNGNGTFQVQAAVALPTGFSGQESLAAGDFRGDGHTDLAVVNADQNQVCVFLGKGDGTFQDPATLPFTFQFPLAPVAAHFTGSGRDDLAIANNGGDTISVLLSNPDGTFRQGPLLPTNRGPDALVAGDFTGDSHMGLAAGTYGGNTVNVFVGGGDGSFRATAALSVGRGPVALATGEFTGDGHADLVSANVYDGTVSVLLGRGDGTFRGPSNSLSVFSSPDAVVAAHFTGDGRTDLAVVNPGTDTVSILLGDGDGTFRLSAQLPVGSHPDALAAGDFTGDGRTDLAVANAHDCTVSIFLGNGDGTFRPGDLIRLPVGSFPGALVAGDFGGDGHTDLAVGDGAAEAVRILLGDGKGGFRAGQTLDVGGFGKLSLVVGHFTGDGHTDLAVANRGVVYFPGFLYPYATTAVSIFLGRGHGTFAAGGTYSLPFFKPQDLVAGDFTGDGVTDLAVLNFSNYSSNVSQVDVLLGKGDGTFGFAHATSLPVGRFPQALAVGDFNGDGMDDLATADNANKSVTVLLANGDGTFHDVNGQIKQSTLAAGRFPIALAAGDFNGDGEADLAVANYGDNTISVFLGRGDGTFRGQVSNRVGRFPDALAVGDFNGDGNADLAVANYADGTVSILLGNGDGAFKEVTDPNGHPLRPQVGTGPVALVAGEFDGDSIPDLAVANYADGTVSILQGKGDGTFRLAATVPVGREPDALVAGSFAYDGNTDLAVANGGDNTVTVLLGNGDNTFRPGPTLPTGTRPVALAAGNFLGDGNTDLAVANYGDNALSIFLGNGDGTFDAAPGVPVGHGPAALVVGVFTAEGTADLAVANAADNTVSIVLGNGDGTFRAGPTLAAGSEPIALVAFDFSGSGVTDLAVANAGNNTLSLFLGNGNGFAGAKSRLLFVGWFPDALVAGNFHGQGDTDLAVANPADNTVTVLLSNGQGGFIPVGLGDTGNGFGQAVVGTSGPAGLGAGVVVPSPGPGNVNGNASNSAATTSVGPGAQGLVTATGINVTSATSTADVVGDPETSGDLGADFLGDMAFSSLAEFGSADLRAGTDAAGGLVIGTKAGARLYSRSNTSLGEVPVYSTTREESTGPAEIVEGDEPAPVTTLLDLTFRSRTRPATSSKERRQAPAKSSPGSPMSRLMEQAQWERALAAAGIKDYERWLDEVSRALVIGTAGVGDSAVKALGAGGVEDVLPGGKRLADEINGGVAAGLAIIISIWGMYPAGQPGLRAPFAAGKTPNPKRPG